MTIAEQAGASAPAAGPTVLGWFEPGSTDWHAARANGIGGSEIAAVLGLSPYESRFSLWHRKKGLIGPVEESPQMRWGKKHEPTICDEFAEIHPDAGVVPAPTFCHPDRPWQIANPDRLLVGQRPGTARPAALLEAKTARDDEGWGEEGTGQIPVWYRAQCQWYLDVLGVKVCHVAVLIGLSDYREYVVEYDPDEARILREAGARFIDDLARDVRPDIDGHSATYQAIREIPEGLDPVDVEIPTLLRDRFHAAQDAFWTAEDELTACKGELLDAIGTGQRAVCERQRIATRTVRDGNTYSLMPARTRRNAR
ncbi:YqaJ viral recombinase family protein [Streptomyces caniscabiei]|uniref:YqaJ viral recombinase family nuclease n=1 Tax=Streptomyces caniscabiei TaxID=2746961 RepID=UPI0029B78DA8|nr:YqaJ viral recombinase family protein [Streptomyces caniscabiei]MDX3516224.1 YqaJ viral recombinase family protein [Streptomyces caniscabiei]MDX3724870.1 YqaJ viral recombinase family protein [Streptomyces caniscabiei]